MSCTALSFDLQRRSERHAEERTATEWCLRHEHPLRSGLPRKRYARTDYVTPLCDAIRALHSPFAHKAMVDLMRMNNKRLRTVHTQLPRETECRQRSFATWRCTRCGNASASSLIVEHDATTCPCGAVQAGGALVATCRDRLGTLEEDDDTVHADLPCASQRDVYADATGSLYARRQRRLHDLQRQSTMAGTRTKGFGGIRSAQRLTLEGAAKHEHQLRILGGSALCEKEELRLIKVFIKIEQMLRQMSPVDNAVQRAVRMDADGVWHKAAKHRRGCSRGCNCRRDLNRFGVGIISTALLDTTFERLLDGQSGPDPDVVSTGMRAHLESLRLQLRRSLAFNTSTTFATHLALASSVIRCLHATEERNVPNDCAHDDERACASAGGMAASAEGVQRDLAEAVSSVFHQLRLSLPVAVRECAHRVLCARAFAERCACVGDEHGLTKNGLAFCILHALRRHLQASPHLHAHSCASDTFFRDGAARAQLEALHIDLTADVVDTVTMSIYKLLTGDDFAHLVRQCTHAVEDDLF